MKLCLAVLVGSMFSCALAQDMLELSFKGSAEVRSAYLSRGKVVDKRPFSAQFADGRLGLWGWGSFGVSVWSVSSFSREGQSASRRNAYNEADYNLHYDYGFCGDSPREADVLDWRAVSDTLRQFSGGI